MKFIVSFVHVTEAVIKMKEPYCGKFCYPK